MIFHSCKSTVMYSQQRIFFDFLRFCIGTTDKIPPTLEGSDWQVLYGIAEKQALIGVLFHGIKQMPKVLAPNSMLLMQWMGMAQKIRQQNARLFKDSVIVCARFKQDGFCNCILKGQGLSLLYPDPYMRTSGDIDIYLAGGRQKISKYVNSVCPEQVMRYHHIDFPVMKTSLEVHFTPSYMFFLLHNLRMQEWFKKMMNLQCSNIVTLPDGYGEITVPTTSFNVIYVLSHLYRHLFTEGIGLRQLLDYYFVLMNIDITDKTKNDDVKDVFEQTLKHLGLWKFAKAVMYVMKEVFWLPENKMIAPMDEKEGRFLLDEVMQGGNFGQYDDRMGNKVDESKVHRYFRMNIRNLRFVMHYPSEAICEPVFRTCFAVWKKMHRIK